MEVGESNKIEIPTCFIAGVGVIIGAVLSILIEDPLKILLEPFKRWLGINGLLIIAIVFLFSVFAFIEFCCHNHIRPSFSKRTGTTLGLLIFLIIPIVWLSLNQAGFVTSNIKLLFILMALIAIASLLSPFIPGNLAFLKSLLMVVSAISLGAAVGASGIIFAGNTINYGTPFPDATVIVMDYSHALPDLSGEYQVKAMTYEVVRYVNEIRASIADIPKYESHPVSKDLKIIFDGHPIPPDGERRYFSLEGGKSYKLILM